MLNKNVIARNKNLAVHTLPSFEMHPSRMLDLYNHAVLFTVSTFVIDFIKVILQKIVAIVRSTGKKSFIVTYGAIGQSALGNRQ